MIIGYWNANLGTSGNSLFGQTMVDFCEENNLVISTTKLLPHDSYSHISNRTDNIFKTWIDHAVSSKDAHMAIEYIDMLYNVTDDDHLPFAVHLNVDSIPKVTMETNDVISRVNWCNIKDTELLKYYNNTEEILGKIKLPIDALNCQNLKCQNNLHMQDLSKFYSEINNSLTKASSHLYIERTKNYVPRPGWTEYVSELYDYSKTCRQMWLDSNVPRQGVIHKNYVKARARFKYALNYISKNEQKLRKEAMAKNLANKDTTDFWKDVAKNNNSKTPLPDHIDEAKGSDEILKLWKKHFHDIFNCLKPENKTDRSYVLNNSVNEITVKPYMVMEAIK